MLFTSVLMVPSRADLFSCLLVCLIFVLSVVAGFYFGFFSRGSCFQASDSSSRYSYQRATDRVRLPSSSHQQYRLYYGLVTSLFRQVSAWRYAFSVRCLACQNQYIANREALEWWQPASRKGSLKAQRLETLVKALVNGPNGRTSRAPLRHTSNFRSRFCGKKTCR
jgi:hypothetical protein